MTPRRMQHIDVTCRHHDEQVSSVARIFNTIGKVFTAVEHLAFIHNRDLPSRNYNYDVARTEWRTIIRSLINVKTLNVDSMLITDLYRCLRLDDGEDPLELLPELQELRCPRLNHRNLGALPSFIDARQDAGRPVTVIVYGPKQGTWRPWSRHILCGLRGHS